MRFTKRYAILFSLLLASCSTSDPFRVGDDRYMISTTNYTGLSTRAGQIQRGWTMPTTSVPSEAGSLSCRATMARGYRG